MNKIKYLRLFVFLRNSKSFAFFLRILLLPLCLTYVLMRSFTLKEFLIIFPFLFIINFFCNKYIVEASIKKGEEIRNKNRIKRRQKNKK